MLEIELDLGGYPLRLCDTAGIRTEGVADEVEAEGIRRARELVRTSALKLVVIDASERAHCTLAHVEGLLESASGGSTCDGRLPEGVVVLLNKADLAPGAEACAAAMGLDGSDHVLLSCATGDGLPSLVELLENKLRQLLDADGNVETLLITRARHREHIEEAVLALRRFCEAPLLLDLAAEELRIAAHELGKITGDVVVEEMLDIIFRDFCIGK